MPNILSKAKCGSKYGGSGLNHSEIRPIPTRNFVDLDIAVLPPSLATEPSLYNFANDISLNRP